MALQLLSQCFQAEERTLVGSSTLNNGVADPPVRLSQKFVKVRCLLAVDTIWLLFFVGQNVFFRVKFAEKFNSYHFTK